MEERAADSVDSDEEISAADLEPENDREAADRSEYEEDSEGDGEIGSAAEVEDSEEEEEEEEEEE